MTVPWKRPEAQALRRRSFLASMVGALASVKSAKALQERICRTGIEDPAMAPFDDLMTAFLAEHKAPGAALAVARQGKLIYARGFGFADVKAKQPVEPDALFRIASVSKPVTAAAVLRFVEKGELGLDDKIVDRMKLKTAASAGRESEARWEQITIRHCLLHSGGWDRNKSYDPITKAWSIAKESGIQPPVSPDMVVRYMMGKPLDFNPGERYAYSNLGYLVLGRILEAVAGRKYEDVVQQQVLRPIGVASMKLGRALEEHRAKGEVRYYDLKNRTGPSLYPPRLAQRVPIQYGAANFEAYEAHGGWIASAIDLVKFAAAFDRPDRCPILKEKTIHEMWARPAGALGAGKDGKPTPTYYGLGWNVRPINKVRAVNAWHSGNIIGTRALLVRRWDGLDWAVLFNTDQSANGRSLSDLIDSRLHEAARQVKQWPTTDLFRKS